MKLKANELAYIQNVVQTAGLVKIDSIIIEPNKIRGIDDDRSVVILHEKDVPEFPFNSIGLNRLDVFSARYEIIRTSADHTVEATMDDKNEFARALTMKATGSKIDYRCANPATIQAPKTMNDAIKYKLELTAEAAFLISKGSSAMKAEDIELIGNKDGLFFKIEDINKDAFEHKFADDVLSGGPANFAHRYALKNLLVLLKNRADENVFLTSKGIIKLTVNNLDLYIPPRK